MTGFFFRHTTELLNEDFDAPDVVADADLCRSIAAGKWGLHPDAWGSYETMRIAAPPPDPDPGRDMPVDPAWEAEHRRRPVEPSPWNVKREPRPKPAKQPPAYMQTAAWERSTWPPVDTIHGVPQPQGGTLKLTCDNCSAEFKQRLHYPSGGRPAFVIAIRAMGREAGWTCIAGTDRCPKCSSRAAPQPFDLGAQLGDVAEHGP